MNNKSKAELYAEFFKHVEPKRLECYNAYVTKEGTFYTDSMTLTASGALQLADWIYDTFGVPKIPGSKQPGWSRED